MKLGPNQEKWLKALPGYEKAEHTLCVKGVGFCCLGVAADIFRPECDWEFTDNSGFGAYHNNRAWVERSLENDEEIIESLGLRNGEGVFLKVITIEGVKYDCLAVVNDSCPLATDHTWMANFIREHADLIFTEPK